MDEFLHSHTAPWLVRNTIQLGDGYCNPFRLA